MRASIARQRGPAGVTGSRRNVVSNQSADATDGKQQRMVVPRSRRNKTGSVLQEALFRRHDNLSLDKRAELWFPSCCYNSPLGLNGPSALWNRSVLDISGRHVCRLFLHRPVQEHLSIHVVPAVHATPHDHVFPRLARAEQIRIRGDHHSAAAAAWACVLLHGCLL